MIRPILSMILFSLITFSAVAVAADRAFHEVVSETPQTVELIARFPEPALTVRGESGTSWTDVHLPGLPAPGEIGAPALPEYGILLAVPRGTEPQANLLAADDTLRASPAPPAVLDWDPDRHKSILRAPLAGEIEWQSAARLVTLERLGIVRHLDLARVAIRPVRYDAGDATWRAVREVRLRVEFVALEDADHTAAVPDAIDLELAESVANPSAVPLAWTLDTGSTAAGAVVPVPEPSVMTPVHVTIRDAGLYRIGRADLDAAGADVTGIDPSTFVLTHRGVEVAIEVVDGGDGSFDAPDDVIRFYGQAVGGEETRDNVYRLTGGIRAGWRMESRDATPEPADPQPAHYRDARQYETNYFYWSSPPTPTTTPWYWAEFAISTPGVDVDGTLDVGLSNISTDPDAVGRLEVRVQSRREMPGADPSHHVRIFFNDHLVDDQTWTGLQARDLAGDVPQPWVLEGTNSIRIVNVADLGLTVQSELIDWIRLEYYDRFVAQNDSLEFGIEPPGPVRPVIEGFSGSAVRLYDVSIREAPVQLTGFETRLDGSSWTAEFSDDLLSSPTQVEYVAVLDGSERVPDGFEADLLPNALRDAASGGADLLIVAWDGFLDAIQPLVSHREADGLRVVAAKVGDVLDEFNGGIAEVEGIRNFVAWAFENYAPPAPSLLILVGDATVDPADFRGEGGNYVSSPLFWLHVGAIVPTDNRLAAVNGGDLIPDLAVGRFSVRSVAEVEDYVANVLDHQTAPPVAALNSGMLWVADDDEPQFESILEDLMAWHQPEAMESRRVYLRTYVEGGQSMEEATDDIRTAIDSGSLMTTYMGHGNRMLWAQGLWENADVTTLAPTGHLTFVSALSCMNGYFTNLDPETRSLSEEWNLQRYSGAIGNLSVSAVGTLFDHRSLAERLFERVFEWRETRMGLAAWRALLDSYLLDGRPIEYIRQIVYFGDPAAWLQLDSDRNGLLDREEIECNLNEDCDDENPCTDDFCDLGACEFINITGSCDDGDACTEDDACASGVCAGTAVDCSNLDDQCNVGVCNPADGSCFAQTTNEGLTCTDSDLCTTGDVCTAGVCSGIPVVCDDADVCTSDNCVGGICDFPANGDCDLSGAVRYYREFDGEFEPSAKPVSGVEIDLDGDGVSDAVSDTGGSYAAPDLAGTYSVAPLSRYGDGEPADANGAVSPFDATYIAEYMVGMEELSTNQQLVADGSGDGTISSLDASLVAQLSVRLIQHLPVADAVGSDWLYWRCDTYTSEDINDCTSPLYTFDPLTGPATASFHAALYGDVTGNWAAPPPAGQGASPALPPTPERQAAQEELRKAIRLRDSAAHEVQRQRVRSTPATLTLEGWSAPMRAGERRVLSLKLSDADGIEALDLVLGYDPALAEIVEVQAVGLGEQLELAKHNDGRTQKVAMYGLLPLQGSGTLLSVTVEALRALSFTPPVQVKAVANEGGIPLEIEVRSPASIKQAAKPAQSRPQRLDPSRSENRPHVRGPVTTPGRN